MIGIAVDRGTHLVTCDASGSTDLPEVERVLRQVLIEGCAFPSFAVLFIVRDIAALLSCTDLRALAPIATEWGHRKCKSRWAIVLPTKPAQVMTDVVVHQLHLSAAAFRCFLSHHEASIWLAQN